MRQHGRDSETLNVIYVVDDRGLLIDDIRMREFLVRPLNDHVSQLMDRRFVTLKATDHEEEAVAVFRREDRTALPVVDTAGVLIGVVTIDDVLDVAEEAATRDIQKIGGSEALDEPYMEVGLAEMVRKRAGWLVVLFLGEMLTATAMGFFEKEIERAVVLALFVPLIISSGGNSGSQASTLVIRALALGEVRLADWWRVIRREMLTGLALGGILGSIGFLRITIWSAFLRPTARTGCSWPRRSPSRSSASCSGARSSDRSCRSSCGVSASTRHLVRAVCRDARGRHRPGDLFQRGDGDPARNAPPAGRPGALALEIERRSN